MAMICTCHRTSMQACPVHRGATPREQQITRFLAHEEREERDRRARAECDRYGHIFVGGDENCVRCGELSEYPLDDIPF